MGFFDFFRQAQSSSLTHQPHLSLFDDEFQHKLEMLSLVSRKVFSGRLRAERRSKKKGSGVEFADHRDYTPGDDFRSVDWNVYRRLGRLLVRLYEEEEDLSIYLILDCSGSMGYGGARKFDQARRLCAAFAYVGLSNLDRVTIVAATETIVRRLPTTRGKGQIFKVLHFLEKLEAQGGTNLAQALRTFVAQHKRRGMAILLSDFYDPKGFEQGINMLRFNKFEPCVIHLVDSEEWQNGLRGDLTLYDCETGEERDVTLNPNLVKAMSHSAQHYREAVQRFCVSRKLPYFAANVKTPFDEVVLGVLRKGGLLG